MRIGSAQALIYRTRERKLVGRKHRSYERFTVTYYRTDGVKQIRCRKSYSSLQAARFEAGRAAAAIAKGRSGHFETHQRGPRDVLARDGCPSSARNPVACRNRRICRSQAARRRRPNRCRERTWQTSRNRDGPQIYCRNGQRDPRGKETRRKLQWWQLLAGYFCWLAIGFCLAKFLSKS